LWLNRLDGLWAVSDKRIEAGSLEDLREGRVGGGILMERSDPTRLQVGLFLVWRSSATKTTHYWLSGSRVPDRKGRFSFDSLGPGRYALALLGRPEDLRGELVGVPGYVEITDERPVVVLDALLVRAQSAAPQTRQPPLRPGR
jgi:hypothetical protein